MLCKIDILKDFVKFFFRNFLVDFAKFLRKNNYYCIYCLDMLKTFQRETKLFEYSRNMNREEMSIRKNDVTLQWLRCNVSFSIALLQWFCWNGFDVMAFVSLVRLCLQTKSPSFLTTVFSRKYRPVRQGILSNENAALAVCTFS